MQRGILVAVLWVLILVVLEVMQLRVPSLSRCFLNFQLSGL